MNIIKQLFSYSLGNIFVLIIGIISVPIITRMISPEDLGKANLIISVAVIIAVIIMLGLDQAFIRFYFDTNPKKLFFKCFTIPLVVSILCCSIILIFNDILNKVFDFNGTSILLLIIYINSFLVFRFNTLILRMLQFGYRYSLIQVLQKILDLIIIITLVIFSVNGDIALLISASATMLILAIITFFMSAEFWKGSFNRTLAISNGELLKYSLPIMIASLITTIFQSIDKVLLGIFSTNTSLGIYVGLYKIIGILGVCQISFSIFWTTASLKMYKENPNNKKFFSNVTNGIIFSMFIIGITVIFMKDYVVMILGKEYRDYVGIILILVNIPIIHTISEATVQGINFKLKTRLHIYISSTALIVTLIIGSILTQKYSVYGTSISMVIGYFILFVLRTYFGMKNYPFKFKLSALAIMLTLYNIWITMLLLGVGKSYLNEIGALLLLLINISLFREDVKNFIKLLKTNWKEIKK